MNIADFVISNDDEDAIDNDLEIVIYIAIIITVN